MKVVNSEYEAMSIFFDETNQANKRVSMGRVIIEPGVRMPKEGYAVHEQDEYSYVIRGNVHTILEDGTDIPATKGDAQLIEANEKHINYNDSDETAEVLWILVERD